MIKVLFLCPQNNGLSQIAEGLLNKEDPEHIRGYSAGFYPSELLPMVKDQMLELNINPDHHYPKSVSEFSNQDFDYVIWVGGGEPHVDFAFVQGKREPISIWHTYLSDPTKAEYPIELHREAHLLQTRMHLLVLSHHQELGLTTA